MVEAETAFPCNHPRTPENTKPNGARPGGRCRTCQRVHERESQRKRRAAVRPRHWEHTEEYLQEHATIDAQEAVLVRLAARELERLTSDEDKRTIHPRR